VDEKGRKNSWEGEQWIVAQENGESEGGKNRNKKVSDGEVNNTEEKNNKTNHPSPPLHTQTQQKAQGTGTTKCSVFW
jgi:hypothetical protein